MKSEYTVMGIMCLVHGADCYSAGDSCTLLVKS